MKNRYLVPGAVLSVTALAVYPLIAQEGGVSATLSVSQRLESGSNLALRIPSEGDTHIATTSLSFNLRSNTRTQNFSLSLGGLFRDGDLPTGSSTSTGFTDPRISLSYAREAANSAFSVNGNFRQSDVTFALTELLDPNGVPLPPADFAGLRGTGQRNTFNASTELDLRRNDPIGIVFSAGVSGIRYSDTNSPTLTDTDRSNFGIKTLLRFSPVTTGRVDYRFDRFESDNMQQTKRDTQSLNFGLKNELASGITVDASAGYQEIKTREIGNDTNDTGLIGELKVSRNLKRGSASASLASTRDQAGDRLTFEVMRNIDLPRGSLSVSAGATSFEGNDPEMIGSLGWRYLLPRDTFSVQLRRSVSANSNDEERLATSASANYNHQINELSSIGLNYTFALTEGTSTANEVQRSGLTAAYRRRINEDWNYSAGVSHDTRDEKTVGDANSTSVFFTIQRTFDLLP